MVMVNRNLSQGLSKTLITAHTGSLWYLPTGWYTSRISILQVKTKVLLRITNYLQTVGISWVKCQPQRLFCMAFHPHWAPTPPQTSLPQALLLGETIACSKLVQGPMARPILSRTLIWPSSNWCKGGKERGCSGTGPRPRPRPEPGFLAPLADYITKCPPGLLGGAVVWGDFSVHKAHSAPEAPFTTSSLPLNCFMCGRNCLPAPCLKNLPTLLAL